MGNIIDKKRGGRQISFGITKKKSSKESVTENYEILAEIGRGAFSVVRKAINKQEGKIYAIKEIDKKLTNNDERIEKEISLLSIVEHPNIIRFKEVFKAPTKVYLVTELAEGGELFDRIMEREHYSEKNASITVYHILSALSYMHSFNFMHRDLKPENILLKFHDDDTTVKLIDFGLATVVSGPLHAACGTPMYSAPEVITAKETGYGLEADLWSIGVITYILLCGYPPFFQDEDETVDELFEKILDGEFVYHEEEWSDISNDAKDFISKLLIKNPLERMTAKEAMEHSWITGSNHTTKNRTALIKSFNLIKCSQIAKVEVQHDGNSEGLPSDDEDDNNNNNNNNVDD